MNTDQVKGKFEQVVGKVKQSVGEAVGDNKTANEGLGDQVTGATRETWGNVKDASTVTADRHAATANRNTEVARDNAHDGANDTRRSISQSIENVKNAVNEHIDGFKETHNK